MVYLVIVSIGALLLGVFVYWREAVSNSFFRGYNSLINKKELKMSVDDKKGFFFMRKIHFRALNALVITALFAAALYYIPFTKLDAQLVIDFWIFFIIGTYVATALPFAKQAMDNPIETLKEVGEKGREVVDDLSKEIKKEDDKEVEETQTESDDTPEEDPPKEESARDRMKRKGYLK